MRVFLTGGTGLLGSHVAAHLRDGRHQVVALCRRGAATRFLERIGCEVVEGDVRDPPDVLASAMSGCTHAAHAAGLVYSGKSWPKVREVNVEGTRHVLEAAASAGVAHAVHFSSVAVYGTVDGPVDEDGPIERDLPKGDLYARSKREAEGVARAVESKGGLGVTVLRPSAAYGERDRLMTLRLARIVRRPVGFLLGPGTNTVPTVYAGNVAVAAILALEAARTGSTYVVGLDHPLTQRALLEGLARGLGQKPLLVPIPAPLARSAATLLQRLAVSTPGIRHLPLARVARLALRENPYTSVRVRRELGWDPPYQHTDALARTGRWLLRSEARAGP